MERDGDRVKELKRDMLRETDRDRERQTERYNGLRETNRERQI